MIIINLEETIYRLRKLYNRGGMLAKIAKKLMGITNIIHASDIPLKSTIGNNVHFRHGGIGVIVHEKAVIGDDCIIMQNVTIGGKHNAYPYIHEKCLIGAGAVILGGVNIGKGAVVGANAVVISDIEEYTIVGGVPAKIIRRISENDLSYL